MKPNLTSTSLSKIPGIGTALMIGATVVPPLAKFAKADGQGADVTISGRVRVGIGKSVLPIPAFFFNQMLRAGIRRTKQKVRSFSSEKRRLHHFVVRELPLRGEPLQLSSIAKALDMPLGNVELLVDELERNKTFLCRKNSDSIDWAYPVTVDDTPHRVTFSSGEHINAA